MLSKNAQQVARLSVPTEAVVLATRTFRNGYSRVKTTVGVVELGRPGVRQARELGFASRILGKHVARTDALESLVVCSFLLGLSVCDVEAAVEETFDEPVIGKSTVAHLSRHARALRTCAST